MSAESHERARKLLRAARVEGISAGERQWLDAHVAGCRECANEANAMAVAIESLRTLGVTAPADVVRRTSLAVHQRAEERRVEKEPAVFLGVAAVMSSVWAIFATPYIWAAFAWLGQLLHVSDAVWQLGFLLWWFLPATVLAAAAGWRHVATSDANSQWATEVNWRSL
jgi:hypothetical protein